MSDDHRKRPIQGERIDFGYCAECFARKLWRLWWSECGSRDCPICVFLEGHPRSTAARKGMR